MKHIRFTMKKLFFALIWFQIATIIIIFSLSYLTAVSQGQETRSNIKPSVLETIKIPKPVGNATGKVLTATVQPGDARALLLKQFITRYQRTSPFLGYTDFIVEMADKYQLDFRLVPSIAMCESNMGVRIPKKDAFNAWGIAVFSSDIQGKRFTDWNHAIEWVSKFIKEKFYDRGITDLYDIGAIWAPPSVAREYSWTRCVQGFMDKIE